MSIKHVETQAIYRLMLEQLKLLSPLAASEAGDLHFSTLSGFMKTSVRKAAILLYDWRTAAKGQRQKTSAEFTVTQRGYHACRSYTCQHSA